MAGDGDQVGDELIVVDVAVDDELSPYPVRGVPSAFHEVRWAGISAEEFGSGIRSAGHDHGG